MCKFKRFLCNILCNTRNLIKNPARYNNSHPVFRITFPLPILVSAGFLVRGLSGNILIQSLQPLLACLVIAILAASICLSLTQPGSMALSPKSPKEILEPVCLATHIALLHLSELDFLRHQHELTPPPCVLLEYIAVIYQTLTPIFPYVVFASENP